MPSLSSEPKASASAWPQSMPPSRIALRRFSSCGPSLGCTVKPSGSSSSASESAISSVARGRVRVDLVEVARHALGRLALALLALGLGRVVRVGQLLHHLRAARLDRGLVREAVVDQAAGVERDHRGVRLDALDLQRLRVRGLVGLVVAEAPVADHVDQDVAPEALAERHRQAHRAAAGVDGVGVDVDDRDVEALGEIGGVARRARVVRIRREADLVVRDHVQRAADAVAGQRLQVERLGHDALAGEGRVAVDRDRERAARVGRGVAALLVGLQRAHAARDDGVHELQVRGIRQQRDVDAPLLDAHLAGLAHDDVDRARGARAVVVLDVARAADRQDLEDVVARAAPRTPAMIDE